MTKKEQQAETAELEKAVSVLKSALRGMAQRKAARYEAEFLLRVRDMIGREIEVNENVKTLFSNTPVDYEIKPLVETKVMDVLTHR